MINYIQTNILDMLEYVGEDSCQNILSSFVCPLNPDVEDFIHTKAIQFEMALERVLEIEHLTGGKTVYIECNNQPTMLSTSLTNSLWQTAYNKCQSKQES